MGAASLVSFMALQTVAMYSTTHPDFVVKDWHIFISYIFCTWICCFTVLYANRALSFIESLGGFFVVAGIVISITICAVMPHINGTPYASHASVWRNWKNTTGWSSNGFVFSLGMLNGAFAVGAPDIASHLAEEMPRYRLDQFS